MNTLKTINVNKITSLIILFLISILLLGGCTPPVPTDTENEVEQVVNEENTPPEEITEQETPVIKLTPTFLPEPEEIKLEVFLRDIMQIEVTDEEMQNKFLKGEYGPVNWEIFKVGTIKIPEEERERKLYSVLQYIETLEENTIYSFDLSIGYVEDGILTYFPNISSFTDRNYFPFTKNFHPIEKKISLEKVSNELKSIDLPGSPHKLMRMEHSVLTWPMFCHLDKYRSNFGVSYFGASDTPVLAFSVDQNFSVWKLSDYFYFARDKLNTCTTYELRYSYILDKDYSFVKLNLKFNNKDISDNWYTPMLFGCAGYKTPHYIKKEDKFITYLDEIKTTPSGEKIFILSKNTSLPTNEELKGIFSGLNIYYFEPMDKISTSEDMKRSWGKFLQSQEEFYPILFIEDTFGNLLIYKNKDFTTERGC